MKLPITLVPAVFLLTIFSDSLVAGNIVVLNNNDSGAGSLRRAVDDLLTGGDPTNTITFDASLSNITIVLASEIVMGSADIQITIDGSSLANPVTLSGNASNRIFRIFSISGEPSLELIGLTLSSGRAPHGAVGQSGEDGGCIDYFGAGDLTLRNCVAGLSSAGNGDGQGFGGNGGAIFFNSSGDLLIEDCTFALCSAGEGGSEFGAVNHAGHGGYGGVIGTSGSGGVTILRSDFSFSAGGEGGTTNSTNAGDGGNGGAIACFSTSDVLISECSFGPTVNSGMGGQSGSGNGGESGHGGAIFLERVTVDNARFIIEDSYFSGCDTGIPGLSTTGTDGVGGNGGAIYVNGASGTIRRCLFDGNGSSNNAGDGGALYISDKGQSTEVDVENSTFTQNQSTRIGGAIAVSGADSDVNVRHCTIVGNTADYSGGGIAGNDSSVVMTVENCVVSENFSGLGGDNLNFEITNGATYQKLATNFTFGAPMLSSLTDVGAVQEAMVPTAGSPLIDGGTASGTLPSTDIRLLPRTFGTAPDIGAVELTYQPDNRIGKRANPATHRINNVYTASGAGQQQVVKLKGRRFSKFWNSVENDGDDDNYSLRAAKVKREYKTKSFALTGGRANITALLKGSGYLMAGTTSGDTFVFEHKVKAKGSGRLPKLIWRLTASSNTNGVSPDVVKAKVKPPRP